MILLHFYCLLPEDDLRVNNIGNEIPSGIYKKGEINFSDVINSIKNQKNFPEAGSILTFTGIVRNSSINGKEVTRMQIDSYDELANKKIQEICNELLEFPGLINIKIIHYKGEFNVTDDLVHVIIASAHREEGFKVLRKAVERYKKELTVWKKELYKDGSSEWIH